MSASEDLDLRPRARLDVGALLAAAEAAAPVDAIDAVAEALKTMIAAEHVSFLIADFSGDSLIRLGHSSDRPATRRMGRETAQRVPLLGTAHGRALAAQSVVVVEKDGGAWLYAPVTSRGEAVGVLELRVPRRPDEQTVMEVAQAGHVLAYVVIASRRYTDVFEWGQRSVPLSLAAEIQHRLLPGSYTCEAGQFTLAAWLEPAGNVGGDTFDFALERDTLHLSMTDAMGHEVGAAVLATVLVGALRNGRRAGLGLAEQADSANAGLADFARSGGFVTGQIAREDLRSQTATIVNAGHPPPLRLRDGRVDRLELAADPPFGIDRGYEYRVQALPLEPGDRIMFLTDGMLERNAESVDIPAVLTAGREMHPREAVQHLSQVILEATDGRLSDDATALCFDWHGGSSHQRTTDSGADA